MRVEALRPLNADLLNCIRELPKLTRLWCHNGIAADAHRQTENELLDPSLIGLVEHFRHSLIFVRLRLVNIPTFPKDRVADLLGEDADKFVFKQHMFKEVKNYETIWKRI